MLKTKDKIPHTFKTLVCAAIFHFFTLGIASASAIEVDKTDKKLVASAACSYQWFKDGLLIAGATNQHLCIDKSGIYTLRSINEAGEDFSESVRVIVDGNAVRKIFLIGDSTVTNYNSSSYPMAGWGQVLQYFFEPSAFVIDNRAIGGRSSRSFIEEGRWDGVKTALQADDYLFIQFGHNDRDWTKAERYTPPADYKNYLKQYVNESRALGAIPVLVSPMVLNAWRNGVLRNVFTESGNDYRGAMLEVANELNVPFVDLNMESYTLISGVGIGYATRFLYNTYVAGEYPNYPNGNNDFTHFQEMGALEMAKLVVKGIKQLSGNAAVSPLIPSIKPTFSVNISFGNTAAGIITRSGNYPAGATVTLKALPNDGYTFLRWTDGSNNTVSSNAMYSFQMGSSARNYKAVFTANTGDIVSGGTYKITAKHSAQSIDVTGRSWENGARLIQYPYSGATNQQWIVQDVGSGSYTLTAVHSNKSMDVNARSTADGAAIIQWASNSSATNQQFKLVDAGDGYYQIISVNSNKCVDVEAVSMANGARLQQWSCNGGDNQLFKFELLSSAAQKMGHRYNRSNEISLQPPSMSLYPNPTNTFFHLKVNGTFTYTIFDQLGHKKEFGASKNESLLGESLVPGFYILKVQTENGSKEYKLIKQ